LGTEYGTSGFGNKTVLKDYPIAARRMLVQNWLADPNVYKNNGNLIVLDPFNWDHKPEPLVVADPFKEPRAKKPKAPQVVDPDCEIPWN
jgi:hypothetical protein